MLFPLIDPGFYVCGMGLEMSMSQALGRINDKMSQDWHMRSAS